MTLRIMTSHDTDQLGVRLRDARLAAGLSQESVARALNVATRTVIRWEQRGSALLVLDRINTLADLYGVKPSTLLPECDDVGGAAA